MSIPFTWPVSASPSTADIRRESARTLLGRAEELRLWLASSGHEDEARVVEEMARRLMRIGSELDTKTRAVVDRDDALLGAQAALNGES